MYSTPCYSSFYSKMTRLRLFKNVQASLPCEALLADGLLLDELRVCLVLADDLPHPGLVVVRVQNLIEPAAKYSCVNKNLTANRIQKGTKFIAVLRIRTIIWPDQDLTSKNRIRILVDIKFLANFCNKKS
jgi:hypothetical protein